MYNSHRRVVVVKNVLSIKCGYKYTFPCHTQPKRPIYLYTENELQQTILKYKISCFAIHFVHTSRMLLYVHLHIIIIVHPYIHTGALTESHRATNETHKMKTKFQHTKFVQKVHECMLLLLLFWRSWACYDSIFWRMIWNDLPECPSCQFKAKNFSFSLVNKIKFKNLSWKDRENYHPIWYSATPFSIDHLVIYKHSNTCTRAERNAYPHTNEQKKNIILMTEILVKVIKIGNIVHTDHVLLT